MSYIAVKVIPLLLRCKRALPLTVEPSLSGLQRASVAEVDEEAGDAVLLCGSGHVLGLALG